MPITLDAWTDRLRDQGNDRDAEIWKSVGSLELRVYRQYGDGICGDGQGDGNGYGDSGLAYGCGLTRTNEHRAEYCGYPRETRPGYPTIFLEGIWGED